MTFDSYELEQPRGSSESGCSKNFTKEPGIVGAYFVIARATVSPSTETQKIPCTVSRE